MSGLIFNSLLGSSGSSSPAGGNEAAEALKDANNVSQELDNSNKNQNMWGGIVSGVTGLVGSFNYKAQQNQIEMARLNAEAAKSNADASANTGKNKAVWIAVAIIVVIVLIVLLKPKSSN